MLKGVCNYLVEGFVSLATVFRSPVLVDSSIPRISSVFAASNVIEDFDGEETFKFVEPSLKIFKASGELGISESDDFVNVFRSLNFLMFRLKNSCLLGRCADCKVYLRP